MPHLLRKKQIREIIKRERSNLSNAQIDVASERICENIIDSKLFQAASIIFLYASMGFEVQTKYIARCAKEQGKEIAFPKIDPISQEMDFYKVNNLSELETNQYGSFCLQEPNPSIHPLLLPTKENLMIVPGVAFDKNKHRIGYGGGFYDRYLEKHMVNTIGIGFDFQLLEDIPTEPHDQILNVIVTDKRVL